jgi:hypothetical protein
MQSIQAEASSTKNNKDRSMWPTWPKGRRKAATGSNNGRKNHTADIGTIVPMTVQTASRKGRWTKPLRGMQED